MRHSSGYRKPLALAVILIGASLMGASPVKLPSPPPALRDDIVFDETRYNAFFDEMSYDPQARTFILQAELNALEQLPAYRAKAKAEYAPMNFRALFSRALTKKDVILRPDKTENRNLIYSLSLDQGISPTYMISLAARESGLNNFAHSRTSSASGLFQFTRTTWLCSLKQYGHLYGVAGIDDIVTTPTGACDVADPKERSRLLSLRFDPNVSTAIATKTTHESYDLIAKALGRMPTAADLYSLHFFGEADGLAFLTSNPYALAYKVAPRAAASNPDIFWTRDRRPRYVYEVYDNFDIGA